MTRSPNAHSVLENNSSFTSWCKAEFLPLWSVEVC